MCVCVMFAIVNNYFGVHSHLLTPLLPHYYMNYVQQCDIPEEYKVAGPKVDVMSFLGIRRAEPLVPSMRDWD